MAVRIHLNGQWFLGSLALVLSIGIINATTTSDAATNAQTQAGWQLLQRGETGLVVAMRHAIAPGTGDPANFKLGDCSTQRNLSAQGRTQAQQIGAEFRNRNIKIARVLSSQWCRCLETAKLINLGKVEPLRTLNSFFSDSSKEARQTATIRKLIVDNRNTKGAIIMVTHQVNITAITNIVPQSGEAVILKSDEQGKIKIVGRIGGF
ncbi:MAG: histidine phosphatase family protein [Microcoleus sp. PH2017_40_RAT_O_B]|uniref:histidine phosphatase family protein n=1 Tax=unclassified Microcoleus TaxID=2642155 RepID=UPI001DE0E541|nr:MULTISPECIES: histidine phosphatase family protein [unclassified Microcoleus]TAF90704.1 MAG: histidine phosphatase family protein [Oscillatoriales cyanobacterium]MCC3449359.1 histidine phosphatase family protein [Microcoleus sp. PH2017_09_SFU_O_A]MCC3564727.1 histidine phosphatase family protein [Microcoleus sp. PH2017_31_RDM_U_A]MCC3570595.1 histidine phosphatase family protein [Microcoleus sp. PH2017_34_RAT_O_A]MCC3577059.1 histidine phosphatase family protein [Microcoleus sp. PH2017_32_R